MAATIGIVGGVASAASAGAGLANAFGGGGNSTSGSGASSGLTPNQVTGAANQYLSGINQFAPYATNFSSSLFPQAQNLGQQGANNPYAGQAQSGAGYAANYGTGALFPQSANAATSSFGTGDTLGNWIQDALSTGFTNNNALYNQNLQRTIDQSNVINSMYGLGQSPVGANLTDQAVQSFNNNWANNLAQLHQQAAQTAQTLAYGQGNAYNTGAGLGQGAFNAYNTASALPAQTYQGLNANALNALTQSGNAAVGVSAPFQNYLADLSSLWGQSQSAQQAAFNQSQQQGQNLGQSLSMLGNSANNLYQNYGINPVAISGTNVDWSQFG